METIFGLKISFYYLSRFVHLQNQSNNDYNIIMSGSFGMDGDITIGFLVLETILEVTPTLRERR